MGTVKIDNTIIILILLLYRQVRTPYPFDRSASVSFPILESQKMHSKPSLKTYHLPPISDRQAQEVQGACDCLPGASAKLQ